MRRSVLLTLFVCLSAFAFIARTRALVVAPALQVNEKETRLRLEGKKIEVLLAVENPTAREISSRIQLEILDTKNSAILRAEQLTTIGAATQNFVQVPLKIAFDDLSKNQREDFLLYRLRYRISPLEDETKAASGIVSLSEITPDLFELRVAAGSRAKKDLRYLARVFAVHPFNARPVAGVQITGEITLNDGAKNAQKLEARGTSDTNGLATLEFQLPHEIADDELPLKVEGQLGDVSQEADTTISAGETANLLLTTDKPLYQPGQTLHARLLAFDSTRQAIPDAEAKLEISNQDSETIFRAPMKTSRFGISSVDWQIPDNAKLGDYSVRVELNDERYKNGLTFQMIKISRYDLPNFTVQVKPDRAYYLPNENAEVEVRADYLFGEAVKRGHVRVVREMERTWNYKEQKWEAKEAEKYEGDTDADGKFTARIDLSKAHDELKDQTYARYRDLNFAAYFTDPTTNRTEQRRFDLRVTRDPIHIYVTGERYQIARGLPFEFYISASYADGAPAASTVIQVIRQISTTEHDGQRVVEQSREIVLQSVRTNKYGLAKAVLPANLTVDEDKNFSFRFLARDGKGRAGEFSETFYVNERPALRVETNKSLYRAGEPIEVEIQSNQPSLNVFVDIAQEGAVLKSQQVKLADGRAHLRFPFDARFKGALTISAVSTDAQESDYEKYVAASRTILYPHDRELNLDVRFDKDEYRPGAEANAELHLSPKNAAENGSLESAFGVVVFDKAVAERARTDEEFSGNYGFSSYFYNYFYGADAIAGITRRDLEKLDARRPFEKEIDLVAELLLSRNSYDNDDSAAKVFSSREYEKNQAKAYEPLVKAQLKPARDILNLNYAETQTYPRNETELRRMLADGGINFDSLVDPWGVAYRARFSVRDALDVLEFVSAGADKTFGTDDDWTAFSLSWDYFRPLGERLQQMVSDYHKRTGAFIRNAETFKREARSIGIDFDTMPDRWGKLYQIRFAVNANYYMISIVSGGKDRKFESEREYPNDDFTIWRIWIDYFAEASARIYEALTFEAKAKHKFPSNETELRAMLRKHDINIDELRDPFGHPYYITFRQEARYADKVKTEQNANGQKRTDIKPVTQTVQFITIRSAGVDGRIGTADDFTVGEFSSLVSEQLANDLLPQPAPAMIPFQRGNGAIQGTVKDPNGAVVTNATVRATNENLPNAIFETTTGSEGKYLIRNLPSGVYTLNVGAVGFARLIITDIIVQSSNLTIVDATLNVAAATETVTVTASGPPLMQTSSSTVDSRQISELPLNGKRSSNLVGLKPGVATSQMPIATPRLREYFPETLVWQPEIVSDNQGRAHLNFKFADNITTWRMSVIGSTVDGQIGTAETEIRAFQPFFVEHDPPKILTVGDEIQLPVVVWNYLSKPQDVSLAIKPESWFTLLDAAQKNAHIEAGDAKRETFAFRATSATNDGKQRITATSASEAEANDAIEKPVRVHPDGEEISRTSSQVFARDGAFDVEIPSNALPDTARVELKIYPNLLAHVAESIEAILRRPYGCGEQTISSTYPGLLLLKSISDKERDSAIARKARRYLQQGYERLLNYRNEEGGFTYWGRNEKADIALTAYALRFLHDARGFVAVDEDAINEARAWLVKQQRADGSFPAHEWYFDKTKSRRDALNTAYVARVLALTLKDAKAAKDDKETAKAIEAAKKSLERALQFLRPRVDEIDEPYLLAAYALAANDAGQTAEAARVIVKLRALAKDENGASFWNLETNTPFYGWGLAGRIETTALVLQALATSRESMNDDKNALINRGLAFLIRHKDAYGVWYSTQATINTLDALISLLHRSGVQSSEQPVQILVNNQHALDVALPPANQLTSPIILDLSRFAHAGANKIEIRRQSSDSNSFAAQVVTDYYVAWKDAENLKQQNAMRLAVNYDQTNLAVNQEVACRVKAERVGFQGYGMMLAEIGLPPGAEIDRASLEHAMKEAGWDVSRYDVLPDRLILYLWSRAGGTNFTFKFKPRFGLNAQTSASTLYDYYNPEARATLAPTRFVVR